MRKAARLKIHWRFWLWLLLLGGLITALIPWQWQMRQTATTFIYCVDASASLSQQEQQAMLDVLKKTFHDTKNADNHHQILCFGEQVRILPQIPAYLPRESATDLHSAIQMALAIIEQRQLPGKIALFTDGSAIEDFELLTQHCARANVPVFVWYPPQRREWQFLALDVPPTILQGTKIPLEIIYRSNFQGRLRLKAFANNLPYLEQDIEITKTRRASIQIQGPPLTARYVYFSAQAQGDDRHENNKAFAFTQISTPRPVLLVSNTSLPLARALSVQKLQILRLPWAQLPNNLHQYPLVIIDSPSRTLLANYQKLWPNYLQQGGAILVLSGNKLVSSWLPAQHVPKKNNKPKDVKKSKPPPLTKKQIKTEVQLRSAAIVFVIDQSGSMEGEKLDLAKEAALASIAKLWPQDLVGVIGFESLARWVVPLGQQKNFASVRRRLTNITARGGTAIVPAMTKAYHALERVRAHIKHIIFLSDGQDQNGIFSYGKLEKLATRMRKNNITVTTIGVGTDFDTTLMPLMAQWGQGEFYYASVNRQIPVVVLKDVDRILRLRKIKPQAKSKPKSQAPISLPIPKVSLPKIPPKTVKEFPVSKAYASKLLTSFAEFPSLADYQPYKKRTSATTELLVGSSPLLLHWYWQGGRVMMWNSASNAWQDWPHYAVFWARMIRFLAGDSLFPNAFILKTITNEGQPQLCLTTRQAVANFAIKSPFSFYRLDATTLLANFALPKVGKWQRFAVTIQQAHLPSQTLTTAFARPHAPEVANLKIATQKLTTMARNTNGGILLRDVSKFASPIIRYSSQSLSFWWLWLALCCSLLWILWVPN